MTASIVTVRDTLDRVSLVVDRIEEFSAHGVEFTPLRHLVEKLRGTVASLQGAINSAGMGHALDGASVVIERRRPVGVAATGELALRRAAYVSALMRAMSSGNFEALQHEQELIDPDRAIWRQYVAEAPHRPPHRTHMSIARRHGVIFQKLVAAEAKAKKAAEKASGVAA